MLQAKSYATGADVSVYMTDDPVLPSRFDNELDVSEISIISEGESIPLYKFANALAGQFAYSTSVISGVLDFNYTGQSTHRNHLSDPIHGKALWVVLSMVEWDAEVPRVVKDVYQLDHVWAHPFRHSPQPIAMETVPFTARSLSLVARQFREIRQDAIGSFVDESNIYKIEGRNLFPVQTEYVGNNTVVEVLDGDTYKIRLDSKYGGETIRVRLIGADTPESKSHSDYKRNENNDPSWRWPATAKARDENDLTLGVGGQSPSKDQLDEWGDHISVTMKGLFLGAKVDLITDPGVAPTDDPEFNPFRNRETDRYLYRIRTKSGIDLSSYLIEEGYAVPFYTTSIETGDVSFQSRMAVLDRKYKAARDLAGTDSAKGIWYSFDLQTYLDSL